MELGKLSHGLMILGVDKAAHIPTKGHYVVTVEEESILLNPTGIKLSKIINFQSIDLIKITQLHMAGTFITTNTIANTLFQASTGVCFSTTYLF